MIFSLYSIFMCFCVFCALSYFVQPNAKPAGYYENTAAEFLAQLTGVNVELARLVVSAENGDDEMAGLPEHELIRIRVNRINFLLRVMHQFFELSAMNLI